MIRNVWRSAAALFATAFISLASPVHADTVANGGFEVPIVGGVFNTIPAGSGLLTDWIIAAGSVNVSPSSASVDHIGSYWQAAEGNQSIDLDGSPGDSDESAKIFQGLSLVAGQTYQLSFALAGNPDNVQGEKKVAVSVGNLLQEFTFDTTGKSLGNMGWVYHSVLFTAGLTNTLTFDSSTPGWFGPALDDVQVAAVPLPPALWAGLSLMGLVGAERVRRQRKQNGVGLA